jgi:hypothetical protein
LLWVVGGALFAWLPFDAWVKSGSLVMKPGKPPADAAVLPIAAIAARDPGLRHIELVTQGGRPYYRLVDARGRRGLVDAVSGVALGRPDEATVRRLAREIYQGTGAIVAVHLLDKVERRGLGLVDETHGKLPLWQVRFDDRLNTRLYFSPESGEFDRARNDAWVLYDFFWRLHIMDYGQGEDFNNALLRTLAPFALVLVLSGVFLLLSGRFAGASAKR